MTPPRLDDVASFRALCEAVRDAARGKRRKAAMADVLCRMEPLAIALERELRDRTWRPRPFRTFTVTDPKPRTISAADPRDRVVHHALCRVLEPWFERQAIADSYACRRGKGTHAAVARARQWAREHPFFLKMDVRHFFETLDHGVLKGLLRDVIEDEGILWIAGQIVDQGAPGSAPGKGLPIGNLTSQHFAGLYLSALDGHVRDALGNPPYLRYMDDLLVFGPSKRGLRHVEAGIRAFLEGRLLLQVKEEATMVAPVFEGIPFLGFRVFPGCVRLRHRGRQRLVRALRRAAAIEADQGDEPVAGILASESLIAHARHADTLAFRRSLMENPPSRGGASRARTG